MLNRAPERRIRRLRMAWLHPGHVLFMLILLMGLSFPTLLEGALDGITDFFAQKFGWLVMLSCSFFVGFAAWLALSRYGRLRLGGVGETPQFSTLSWLAMLFAAGMGSGLIFYGAAEPLLHYQNPPPSANLINQEAEMARRAMAITFFHWGIHAWAIYAMAALAIAYFAFHKHMPMLPSAAITHRLHPRWQRPTRRLVDTVAILGVVFGLVSSLCQAMLQLSEGVQSQLLPDMPLLTLQLVLLLLMFICYMASASTGISKGIKILSDINMSVAVLLMLFILIVGPTIFILNTFTTAIGDYLDQFVSLSFNTRPFSDREGWTGSWSITYFLWWISWGPFVGVFIARISRGRTIREFLLGVILVPSVFSFLWFASFGGTALHLELFDMPGFAGNAPPPGIIFAMLDQLPLDLMISLIVLLLLFVFLVTSADSGTYVLGMFTTEGNPDPVLRERLFWGVMVAIVTAGALLSGRGTEFFRAFAVVGSIPYLAVMLWQMAALRRQLKDDLAKELPLDKH